MLYNYNHVDLKSQYAVLAVVCFTVLCILLPLGVFAQNNSLSITIAPPLIQPNLQSGETWTSGISVVNNNDYDVTLYAEPYLFKPVGESGRPYFLSPTDLIDSGDTEAEAGLTSWITIPNGGFTVKSGQTYILPIAIEVPNDAPPGGHYAAILIGNRIPDDDKEGGTVSVSSAVASLIFMSVAGDIVEKGRVRDFFTEETLYQHADANFTLRFENQGNVHLLPRGYIKIFNMFGKERGYIPVNESNGYGNVLPDSIRNYSFNWKSDSGLWDIGRYKAEATISYGSDFKQSALSTSYFYILPIVPLLQVLFGLFVIILFVSWSLKAYVRRALALETQNLRKHTIPTDTPQREEEHKVSIGTLVKPIQAGLVDLRRTTVSKEYISQQQEVVTETIPEEKMSVGLFIKKYRLFFVFIFLGIIVWFGVRLFVEDVTTVERAYDVSELKADGSIMPLQTDHIE